MGYNKSPFKMATKSPLAKALKGSQGKLPQALQDAIKAAPESPAKQTKEEASAYMDGLREKRAQKAEKSGDAGRAQRIRSTKDSQDGVESPVKQTTGKKTVGGKSLKEVGSTADVPKSTSFGGTNYKLGAQTGSGPHYFNEGFSSKHEKQGTIKRPGDAGVYHVSRETEKPMTLNKKKASIKSPAKKYKK